MSDAVLACMECSNSSVIMPEDAVFNQLWESLISSNEMFSGIKSELLLHAFIFCPNL